MRPGPRARPRAAAAAPCRAAPDEHWPPRIPDLRARNDRKPPRLASRQPPPAAPTGELDPPSLLPRADQRLENRRIVGILREGEPIHDGHFIRLRLREGS